MTVKSSTHELQASLLLGKLVGDFSFRTQLLDFFRHLLKKLEFESSLHNPAPNHSGSPFPRGKQPWDRFNNRCRPQLQYSFQLSRSSTLATSEESAGITTMLCSSAMESAYQPLVCSM
jgi:hypothetical protein